MQNGKKELYNTIGPDVESMKKFLLKQKKEFSGKTHLVFEVSGQSGFLYDSLIDSVDSLTVANPSKMTWIFRTSKKNDRIDAYKMAKLLYMDEIPAVYMPNKEVRQWRQSILHRQKIVPKKVKAKNQIRSVLKSQGYKKPENSGSLSRYDPVSLASRIVTEQSSISENTRKISRQRSSLCTTT